MFSVNYKTILNQYKTYRRHSSLACRGQELPTAQSSGCFQERLFVSFVRSAQILLSENRRSKTQSTKQRESRQRKANFSFEKPSFAVMSVITIHQAALEQKCDCCIMTVASAGHLILRSQIWRSCQLCSTIYTRYYVIDIRGNKIHPNWGVREKCQLIPQKPFKSGLA